MSRDSQRLVPRLRFPEFGDAGLHTVSLADVATESTERNGNRLGANSVMGVFKSEGIVPMEERLVSSDIARYKIVRKDWYAYNPMRLNIGSIARWSGNTDVLVSPDYVVFRCLGGPEPGIDPEFLDQFRRSSAWESFVGLEGNGSVRVRIYFDDLGKVPMALPSIEEQRKIAACLSSLDELIAAEGQKLDTLKTHKKGLMQQLFPREGETLPRLRFPEFRGAGEWAIGPLSRHVELISGLHLSPDEYSESGDVPYFTGPSDFTDDFSTCRKWAARSTNLARLGDTVVTVKGSGVGELLFLAIDEVAMGRQLMSVRPVSVDNRFLFHYLINQRQRLNRRASGNLIPGLARGDILSLQMAVPRKDEQSKIAAVLSSLDEGIAAQARKIDALKAHKKGLMQGLFPSIPGDTY